MGLSKLEYAENYIFDMDGTLINSSTEVLECLQQACKNIKTAIDLSKFNTDIIGPPLIDIFRNIIFGNENEQLLNELVKEFNNIYDFDENDPSYLYENIYEWLITLKNKGKRIFMATNKYSNPTQRLIKKLKLNMFEDIYTIDKYPSQTLSKKDMIAEIIEKYNLAKSETVMIGDAPSDIEAAHHSNIKAVGVLWGYGDHKEEIEKIADFILDLDDLKVVTKI